MSRPPLPTGLKLVKGTARGDRANSREPEPELLDDLAPPRHLSAAASAVWADLAPMLRRTRVLTVADVIALEMLCDAVADYRHARMQRGYQFVVDSAKGSPMLNQWLVAQQSCSKRAETLMGAFGMTPASRARVMTAEHQADLFDGDAPAPQGPSRFFAVR